MTFMLSEMNGNNAASKLAIVAIANKSELGSYSKPSMIKQLSYSSSSLDTYH